MNELQIFMKIMFISIFEGDLNFIIVTFSLIENN